VIENNGSPISSHEIWIDDGEKGSFVKVESYDQSFSFVISQAVETSLVTGKIYRIKVRA
jgi:hypothetical protein